MPHRTALAVPAKAGWSLMMAGVSTLIAVMPDVGTITLAVTGIGGAMIGLYVGGVHAITKAKIDAHKAWEEANKGSLTDQLTQVNDSLDKARASLHELRNEAHLEQMRLRAEIARLEKSLKEANDELRAMRTEYRLLMSAMKSTNLMVQDNVKRLDKIEGAGGGDPAAREEREDA